MTGRTVWINPSGQRANLGDSVLRRGFLNRQREDGVLRVLVKADGDYETGLGLRSSDHVYRSRARWLAGLVFSRPFRSKVLAMNPGEVVPDRRYWVTFAWFGLAALAVRAGGGRVIASGIGVRDPARRSRRLAALLRLCTSVDWRDPESRAAYRTGGVLPDWAFWEQSPSAEPATRDRLTVVMRGDRPAPSTAWLAIVGEAARRLELSIDVLVQVRPDETRAKELAELLGGRLVPWPPDATHADHEPVVREQYRRSLVTVSDRIHALIIGMTEGAVPIGMPTGPAGKIVRTMSPVGGCVVILPADADIAGGTERLAQAAADSERVAVELTAAKEELEGQS